MKVYELLGESFEKYKTRTEISQKHFEVLHGILWSQIMGDQWLLDCKDPETRVGVFMLEFERSIDRLLAESGTEEEALVRYY